MSHSNQVDEAHPKTHYPAAAMHGCKPAFFFSFFLFSSALVFFFFLSEHSIPEYEHALVLECDRSAAIEARGVNSTL